MALFLGKMKKAAGKDQMVISVPSWYNSLQRSAMLNSAEIADVDCLQLMNDHEAVALQYSYSKRFDP